MGALSISHWLILMLVVVLLFGKGRISETMGDFGKGLRSFRKGLTDGDEVKPTAPSQTNLAPLPTSTVSETVEAKPE